MLNELFGEEVNVGSLVLGVDLRKFVG